MEDEDGYTALNFQSRRLERISAAGAASPAGKPAVSHRLHWRNIIIWIGCIWNLMLLVTVIVLVLQLMKAKSGTDVKCSLGDFQSFPKTRLCNQSQSPSSVNSTCKLCPVHWFLHKDMCYWPSEDDKSWNESQKDCLLNHSYLMVIQNREEMEFIKRITRGTNTYWIGLSLSSSENKWIWITGIQFDENVFDGPKATQKNSCGTISNKINADKCSAVRRWICQKKAVFL